MTDLGAGTLEAGRIKGGGCCKIVLCGGFNLEGYQWPTSTFHWWWA